MAKAKNSNPALPALSEHESPLLPCPTSPLQQAEGETYGETFGRPRRYYPYDKPDDIVTREISDNDEDD